MASTVRLHPTRRAARAAAALTCWFALVLALGAAEAFVAPPGQPPLRVVIGAGAPIVAFLCALLLRPFRDFVAAADLRLLVAIQGWRFGGLGFLALYANGVLPGTFAWPAGLGDVAIGVTAPWVVVALLRRPDFAASRTFRVWNLLGILDLVVAVSMGALDSLLGAGTVRPVTTAPMSHLPLVLVPAFLVPIFVMLHLGALLQAARLRGRGRERREGEIDAGAGAHPKRVA